LTPFLKRTHSARQKRSDDKTIDLSFTIEYNEPLSILNFSDSQEFTISSSQNPFGLSNGFKHLYAPTVKFSVLIGDVRPTLVVQADRLTVF